MKPQIILCLSVACALAAHACTNGDGGTAVSPSAPFGTELAPRNGFEPATSGDLIGPLCARACANIDAMCPGSTSGGPGCPSGCASSITEFPGCVPQFEAFLSCIGNAQLVCTGSGLDAPECSGVLNALASCGMAGGMPPSP